MLWAPDSDEKLTCGPGHSTYEMYSLVRESGDCRVEARNNSARSQNTYARVMLRLRKDDATREQAAPHLNNYKVSISVDCDASLHSVWADRISGVIAGW